MEKIMVAVDFSELTEEVIMLAVKFQRVFEGELRIVHVADEAPYFAQPATETGSDAEAVMELDRQKQNRMDDIRRRLEQRGIRASYVLLDGPTVDNLLEEANKYGADLIVIGAHRHGRFYHCLLGDVGETLIDRALCPVVVLPHDGSGGETH